MAESFAQTGNQVPVTGTINLSNDPSSDASGNYTDEADLAVFYTGDPLALNALLNLAVNGVPSLTP